MSTRKRAPSTGWISGRYAHGDVALVQVRQDGVRQRARGLFDLAVGRSDRLLGDQDGHAGALGVVVLTRDVQDIGTDDVDNIESASDAPRHTLRRCTARRPGGLRASRQQMS